MSIEDFERAWPYLEPAVAWSRQYTKESMLKVIAEGRAQLWLLPNSALVTRLDVFPSGRKSFAGWLGGGDLNEITAWVKGPALQMALDNKWNEMRVIGGRRGWIRALGWRDVGNIAVLDLDNA